MRSEHHARETTRRRLRHNRAGRLLALLLLVTASAPIGTYAAGDSDGDGVADASDVCEDTDPSDVVGPDGCAICACEDGPDGAGWASQKAFVACVESWVKGARAAGTLGAREARALMRRARNSTCGGADLVRCCVFHSLMADEGRCRIVSEATCDGVAERLFETTDEGGAYSADTGSCLPNPCLF